MSHHTPNDDSHSLVKVIHSPPTSKADRNVSTTLGYTIFYVGDVDATLSFFTDTFGLARKFITPEADYGELDTGATVLAFVSHELANDSLGAAGGYTPISREAPPTGASITLVTDDVAGLVDRAVERGGLLYSPIVDKPWGQTVAYLRDPNGILIEVATAVGG